MQDEYVLPLLMNLCGCAKCCIDIPCKSVNATYDAISDHYAAQQSVQSDGAKSVPAVDFTDHIGCPVCGTLLNLPRRKRNPLGDT